MKKVEYNEEQINKISNLIKQIEVKGDSVIALAMVIQELNNGVVIEESGK